MIPDRIEKRVFLRATRERVWRALSDSTEFGTWFGVRFEGAFRPGARVRGVVTPTTVDPEVAKAQKPYEGTPFEIAIERMEAEKLFSFRWHPYMVEKGVDFSAEPTTLVEFALEDAAGGVMLTVSESGFDGIPLERRAKAFEMNEGGWAKQVELIERYVRDAQ